MLLVLVHHADAVGPEVDPLKRGVLRTPKYIKNRSAERSYSLKFKFKVGFSA